MDQRTKPSVKASIEAAADLRGMEASARAQELLHQGDSPALDEASPPTPALVEAWPLHHDQVVRS